MMSRDDCSIFQGTDVIKVAANELNVSGGSRGERRWEGRSYWRGF